jgi:hypothetical protein
MHRARNPSGLTALGAVAIALLSLSGAGLRSQDPDLGPIHERAIRAHVDFLASDELEGREAGSRGGELTTLYIATQLQRFGLESLAAPAESVAAAAPGAFYQRFELEASRYDEVALEIGGKAFRLGAEFRVFPGSGEGEREGELVFCGYGISASEFQYDDYDGLDLQGKVALILRHEPLEKSGDAWFQGASHTQHARFNVKIQKAVERGAAAVLLVNDPLHCASQGAMGSSGERAIAGLRRGEPRPERRGRAAGGRREAVPIFFGAAALLDHLDKALGLRGLQESIDRERKPASRATGLRARFKVTRRSEVVPSANVAAALRGSDPALRDEWVLVGAHLDHEGIRDGQVMNGANDNASGTAALLLIAEALARQPARPKRSILFVAFHAEEKGLLGSFHYVERPLVPLEKTVAMLNMDMVGRSSGSTVQVFGDGHSRLLERIARETLKRAGIEKPSFGGFQVNARSDHFPFFQKGIPILVYHSDDEGDYHQPTDDADKLTVEVMARIVRAVAMAAWETANSAERPTLRKLRRL